MCLETVYSILGYWNYPLMNIFGDTGCHIANLLRGTGALETQLHSFIMSTTRYVFLFHDNLLLRFNLSTNVSAVVWLHLNPSMTWFDLVFCHSQCNNLNNIFQNFSVLQRLWWDWISYCLYSLVHWYQFRAVLAITKQSLNALEKNIWFFFLKNVPLAIFLKQS